MKKQRSPVYPRKSLPRLLTRLRKYQVKDKNYSEENLAKEIGFAGINGASIPYLSSLKRFDLLRSTNSNEYRLDPVTFDLSDITTDQSVSEKQAKLIEKVAFTPDVFSDIKTNFGKSFPDREELISFLNIYGFTNNSISIVIDSYQQTFDFVAAFDESYENSYETQSLIVVAKRMREAEEAKFVANTDDSATQQVYKLSDKINIVVKIVGFPQSEDLDKLNKFLEHNKEFIEHIEDN